MAYVEVRKNGKLIQRRLVEEDRARKGCRIRVGSAGQMHLRAGESKTLGKYEITMFEGMPPDDEHEVLDKLRTKSDSFPLMSETEQAGFTGPAQNGLLGKKSPIPVIEDYEVTGRLGQGGMGTVWRAVQLSTKREVALKFLGRHRFASKRSRARFEREVSLAAKLTHPNIACVYDSGLHRGVYYYAMELVDGVHLDKYVQQNRLSQREILELMKDVCDAVGYAHEKGIIHRDLKPSNILVTKDGRPHVVDFGLAKASMREEDDLTISIEGEVAGTLAYMSPEQAAGHLDKIGEQTDVYSLGVVLYQLLTDRLPHDTSGSRYEVIKSIVEKEVDSPRKYDEYIDSDLESLLLTALAQEPEDRYPSATILLQDIKNYISGEPLLARSLSATYRIRKRFRKHAKPIAKTFLLVMVVAAIIAIAFCLVSSERKKRLEAEKLVGLRQEGITEQLERSQPSKTLGFLPQDKVKDKDHLSGASKADEPSRQVFRDNTPLLVSKRAAAPAAIQVNGKPFFVMCARSCEPNDFAEVAEAGFNVVSSHNAADAYLEDAKRYGLHVIAYTGQDPDLKVLESQTWSLQNEPILLAWFMPSCPIAYKMPEDKIKKVYQIIHSNDKNHPAFLDFVPQKSSWLQMKSYSKYCDIVAIEPFIYNQNSSVIRGLDIRDRILAVSYWTDSVKKEVAADKPLWVLIQAFAGKGGTGVRPTPQQFRAMAYLAINHGASGITVSGFKKRLWQEDGYNVMGLGDPEMYELRQEALRLAGEIKQLSSAILTGAVLDEVTIMNDEGRIDFKAYAASDNQRIYLVAVNTSDIRVQPTFFVPNMRGTVHILNELRDISRPDGQFSDKFEPYQTHVYDIRIKQNLTKDSLNNSVNHPVLTEYISEISDPPGNLEGNAQKTYLDIISASVYEEEEDLIFTVTMKNSFPDPKQLEIDDSFTIIWFVDSDRSKVTGQGNSGNDYNIHLSCSGIRGWFASWFKTSVVSKKDGITIDRNKLTFHVKDNTAILIVPKSYIPFREFDWWINAWTRPYKGPTAARNPSTERATFNRALSDKQAILVNDFDSNQPFACMLFPGALWRAGKEYEQSVSICEIDHTDGACGTSCSLKWSYQIHRAWVNIQLRLSGADWRTPVDLSMVDAISFYIRGTGLRTCGIKFQANALGSNELTGAAIQLDYGLQWRKIVIPFKDNPVLKGLDLTRMHTISLVDSSPEEGSDVVWIDQMYFHTEEQ